MGHEPTSPFFLDTLYPVCIYSSLLYLGVKNVFIWADPQSCQPRQNIDDLEGDHQISNVNHFYCKILTLKVLRL